MVRGIANSKIGFGDLILLLRYFFKLKVSTHPNQRDLINTLSEAKSQAILGRQNVSVNLNSTASNTPTSLNWQTASNNTLELKNIAADGKQSSLTTTTLAFNANGVVANITQDTLLSICNSRINKKKVIILTKLGTLVFKAEETC
ncbi:GspH/FimT family pseudopilin [Acinetobacter baumannii]|uniref:GspH/FimT family pseudopilin n=2 Tax=Acinetobacter baumannii TaxID=470 RepID=UPI0004F5231D|nr:GspH/FimT family pseudopilin [Acinetobacter baumannii]MCW1509936.1 GspH/FimT family pseudopilin [Acinetobacter baumannii]MCW1514429.1 GspH/FimT family pseudopilin [Acinetobacter baumannii]MDA3359620.1 GspH/FimT family pseudopilin [Acinetobacter baumannii]MDC4537647.1 GspH/FimT family pseudopilin [Acinetobacter baumannii]WFQ21157.1 GspH/FimT family pseudopilin [Acinetobacter baumannii]